MNVVVKTDSYNILVCNRDQGKSNGFAVYTYLFAFLTFFEAWNFCSQQTTANRQRSLQLTACILQWRSFVGISLLAVDCRL